MKLKLEILYYKFLGVLICACPVKSWKNMLLVYAKKRFPAD